MLFRSGVVACMRGYSAGKREENCVTTVITRFAWTFYGSTVPIPIRPVPCESSLTHPVSRIITPSKAFTQNHRVR